MRHLFSPVLLLSSAVLLAACSSPMMASRMSRLSIGMERGNVLAILGEPTSVSNTGQVEVLNYQLPETSREADDEVTHRFIVRLREGKVEVFGRPEDVK